MDYSSFINISLNNYLLLFCVKSSNFYKFCNEYGLNNLKEIFEFFEHNDLEVKNKHSYAEIHGVLNILRYVYLNEKVVFWNRLNKKCVSGKGNKGERFDYLYYKYYDLLRELGFTSSEVFEICGELNYNDTIGNAIVRLYYWKKKNDYKIYTNKSNLVFFKKLEALSIYYLKYYCKKQEINLETEISLNANVNLCMTDIEYIFPNNDIIKIK